MDKLDFEAMQHGQIRTLGDGLDSSFFKKEQKLPDLPIKPSSIVLNSLKPIEPGSKIINLVPKYVAKERKLPKYLVKKPKEPKFVPYEPYKAAVVPIKTPKAIKKPPIIPIIKSETSRNNIEIQELVQQMTEMRTAEMNKAHINAIKGNEVIAKDLWEKQKKQYETDIKNLRETNAHLENQLKFQAQVNGELKTLLVAAVGEDLESRVQHLTEDKLSLARALLNSANHLTSHQEQTEWLSGQCEVWRSKFLASSLMVEELARWKSALTNRTSELQEVTKQLLSEHSKVKKQALTTYNFLKPTLKKLTDESVNLKHANILELTSTNCELAERIKKTVVGNGEEVECYVDKDVCAQTYGEKSAMKILQTSVCLTNKPDALCNALMGVANNLVGEQRFLQNTSLPVCCSHCKGEIQTL